MIYLLSACLFVCLSAISSKMANSNEFCNTYLSKQTNKFSALNAKKQQNKLSKKADSPNGQVPKLNTNSSSNINGPTPPSAYDVSGNLQI